MNCEFARDQIEAPAGYRADVGHPWPAACPLCRFLWLQAHPVGNEGRGQWAAGKRLGLQDTLLGGLGLPDILSAGSQPLCCQEGLPYVDLIPLEWRQRTLFLVPIH